jgi:hypothetical protein
MIEIGKIQYNDMMKVGLFWESRARSWGKMTFASQQICSNEFER